MEKSENRKMIDEAYTDHKPIPIDTTNGISKSVCKIIVQRNKKIINGTGFFIFFSDELKFLVSNYHVISPDLDNEIIELEIWNKKRKKFNLNNRLIKYLKQPKDITAIEIKEKDDVYQDIQFLDFDNNYIKKGYKIYKDADIFSIEYPLGKRAASSSGKIIKINNYEFNHNISTDLGSSGSPILLFNDNFNLIHVIGIHKNGDGKNKINGGTFIGEIINEINKYLEKDLKMNSIENRKLDENKDLIHNKSENNQNNIEENDINNYIIAEFDIKDTDIDKNIEIINSIEHEHAKNHSFDFLIFRKNNFKEKNSNNILAYPEIESKNEKEIKECKIKINDDFITFGYCYKFKNIGKYIIKYFFPNYITNVSHLFDECECIIKLDLSNF